MEKLRRTLEALAKLCSVVKWNPARTGFYSKTYIGNGEYIREYTYIHGNGIKTVTRTY